MMFDLNLLLAQAQAAPTGSTLVDMLARTPLSKIIILAASLTVLRLAMMKKLATTEKHKRTGSYDFLNFTNGLFDAIIYAGVLIFLGVRPFLFQAYQIPSGSMLETLQINDLIGINKAIYRYTDPKLNDIVVFRPPAYGCSPDQLDEKGEPKVDFIKRCVGLPGDMVEVKNSTLYRNGEAIKEPYLRAPMLSDWKLVEDGGEFKPVNIIGDKYNEPGTAVAKRYVAVTAADQQHLKELPAVKIPAGHYLMMGDNRNESFDGRGWGLITREQVVGRSDFIWFPFGRWRMTR